MFLIAVTAAAKTFIQIHCIYTNEGIIIKLIRVKCILLHFAGNKNVQSAGNVGA